MKIIYTYKKNIYAAYEAAYLHLGLDTKLMPKTKNIIKEIKLYYLGLDEDLNEVYIANVGRKVKIFNNVIMGLSNIYGEEIKIINLY